MWNPCSELVKAPARLTVPVLFLLLAACGQSTDGPEIRDAWVRAVPPTSGVTAAYFTLENHGAEAVVITGGHSSVAPRVEMHHMQKNDDDGTYGMTKLETLRVEPGETIRFETGGRHLMLMDMARTPQEGDRVDICLERQDGEPLCHEFPVRAGGVSHHH